jgi:uncharacterized LabA/DUF88 family protein
MPEEKAAVFLDGGFIAKILEDVSMQDVAEGITYKKAIEEELTEPFTLDFHKFSDKLCEIANATRFRTYYYDCLPYQSTPATEQEKVAIQNKQRFFTSLRRCTRFEVREGRVGKYDVNCFKCGNVFKKLHQKRTDNLLDVDVVGLSWRGLIDKAILLAGDSDFVPAFRAAKEAGVITHLFIYEPTTNKTNIQTHDELKDLFDERHILTVKDFLACKKQKPLAKK